MRGGRRGGRRKGGRGRGRGRGQTTSEEKEWHPYSSRFLSVNPTGICTRNQANQSLVLRGPIRCLNNHSSTSSPLIAMPISNDEAFENTISGCPPTASLYDVDILMASECNGPQPPHVDPHSSSQQVFHADEECATNFAPKRSSCFSGLGRVNATELAEEAFGNTISGSPTTASLNDLDTMTASQCNGPQPPQVDPHSSSLQVFHADEECATNFAPKHTSCFSGLGSVNVTELAKKLREDIEDDPEEVESALEPGFVYVNEHRVKVESAPLVESIFQRYSDITKGSVIKSPAFLSFCLERLCAICKELAETKISDITRIQLEKMLDEVEDLEGQKLNVIWLRERIETAVETRIDLDKYLAVKEECDKQETSVKRLEEELSALQGKVEMEKVKNEEMKKVVRDINVRVRQHSRHSLLDGLL